jgi:hypothetical protein
MGRAPLMAEVSSRNIAKQTLLLDGALFLQLIFVLDFGTVSRLLNFALFFILFAMIKEIVNIF